MAKFYTQKSVSAHSVASAQQVASNVSAHPLKDNRTVVPIQRKQIESLKNYQPVSSLQINNDVAQLRKAASRGANHRMYKLPGDVADHIFDNRNDGTGFHSIARNPHALLPHVQQTDNRNRNTQPYMARHVNGVHVVAAVKSMFPDGWSEHQVTETIEKALTSPTINAQTKTTINEHGTTEQQNRPLPAPIRGKANGIRVRGLSNGGTLATVYPVVP